MEGNIKKLAVFVIIAAIALFFAGAMASADGHKGKAIHGEYAATGGGTSFLAPIGFTSDLTPCLASSPGTCAWVIQTTSTEAVYTFERDGTGSARATTSIVTFPYTGPNGPVPASGGSQDGSYEFTYTVNADGMITITAVPGTYIVTRTAGPSKGQTYHLEGFSLTGSITPDGKMITLNAGAPNIVILTPAQAPPFVTQLIINASFVLTWQRGMNQ